ncbi:hypothetical protein BJF85_13105 [Saccharomonospora sp. CUA-673]|uniref:hypothetical protein n=1 Tax=Saccharomonospora sp. CUA-673 TaxID=1904969 RepID=UPI0009646A05|nr:hypothetical protein [Saccharomonospora sp. CUA-673]OLT48182.1 hypothetical protein BJF85_13105 [Saccharomonospora sp. CUA-673]
MFVVGWKAIGVAGAVGILITALVWLWGPSLFATSGGAEERNVQATVTVPADCTNPNAEQTVQFRADGATHEGTLSGCGYDQGEQVEITVPAEIPEGPLDVQLAATHTGMGDLGRPLGMALLVLSCAAGGVYSFLVVRGPRIAV